MRKGRIASTSADFVSLASADFISFSFSPDAPWDGTPVRVGCCANTVAGGARDTIAAQSTTKSRPTTPAAAEVVRRLRRVGANDTADMIILLRGRTILALGECLILGLVPASGFPEVESLTSRRPSSLREAPSRPPVVWAVAVYSTFSSWV